MLTWQGTAMAEIRHQYFDAQPGLFNVSQAEHTIGSVDYQSVSGLRYSSPWPWIFAGAISLAMWASLGWVIWVATR
jgi:hypothetical protein